VPGIGAEGMLTIDGSCDRRRSIARISGGTLACDCRYARDGRSKKMRVRIDEIERAE